MTVPARLALTGASQHALRVSLHRSALASSPCPSTALSSRCGAVRKLSSVVVVGSAGARRTAPSLTPSVRWVHASASSSAPAPPSSSGDGGHLDVFDLFGLKVEDIPGNGWGICEKEIKNTWRKLMAATHPDRMANKTEQEQQAAAQHSTVVNRAYETLLNPLLRSQYLLERHGIAPADEADSLEDSELLMDVLELRERLEDASSEQDAVQVREDNRERLNETLAHLSKAFGSSPPDLEQARKLTVELRYWLNIDKAAREWAPGKRVELQH